MNLYFDNSSTSFPKPKQVVDSINNFTLNIGASPGRGQYKLSLESSRIMFECREALCQLFNFNIPENIVFSYNATYAFNLLLQSLINTNLFKQKPHFLISDLDHNCTVRPLINLKNKGVIDLDVFNCTKDNFWDFEDFKSKINQNTKFVVVSAMSNVLGNIQDIKTLSEICEKLNLFLILDVAQSAGLVNMNLNNLYFSAIIFTGHKNLYSASGVGGFIISNHLLEICDSYFLGGTGSFSSDLVLKNTMPDYFEVGTQNMIGISSLLSGVNFVKTKGIEVIFSKKKQILENIYNKISCIDDIIVLNNPTLENQNSNICINFKNIQPHESAYILDNFFNISVRSGLHCSPNTHKLIGTYPEGCIRISPSIFNVDKEIDFLALSLSKVSKYKYSV